MPRKKIKTEAQEKIKAEPVVQKQTETSEKATGPSQVASMGKSTLSLPNSKPSTAQAVELMRAPEPGSGAAGRARMMGAMQGRIGNASLGRMLDPKVQTKLMVGAPNDVYEQEADRVAETVTQTPEAQPSNEVQVAEGGPASATQPIRAPNQAQRQTTEEADLSVLRAALLSNIKQAHAITSDQAARRRLSELEDRVPLMTAAELRAAIPTVQRQAQAAQTGLNAGSMRLTPSPTPSTSDPLGDPDQVIQESRNHQLYQLIQVLTRSTSFGGRNIRRLLGEMNMTLNDIRWSANSNVGFGAAVAFEGVSGSPPRPQFELILGPAMLVMMNRPNEDMVPTLYHEIYHIYEQFRQGIRGRQPARPNPSQGEMNRRAGLLRGTTLSGDMRFGSEAAEFARSVESELFAELVEHSALQDPSQTGPRTVMTGQGLITRNNPRYNEAEIEEGLRQLRLIFGETTGRRIARALLARANNEPIIHANSRRMFQTRINQIF